jgi:hypothetical protein
MQYMQLTSPECVLTSPECMQLTSPECVLTSPECMQLTSPECVLTSPECVLTSPECMQLTSPECVRSSLKKRLMASPLGTLYKVISWFQSFCVFKFATCTAYAAGVRQQRPEVGRRARPRGHEPGARDPRVPQRHGHAAQGPAGAALHRGGALHVESS